MASIDSASSLTSTGNIARPRKAGSATPTPSQSAEVKAFSELVLAGLSTAIPPSLPFMANAASADPPLVDTGAVSLDGPGPERQPVLSTDEGLSPATSLVLPTTQFQSQELLDSFSPQFSLDQPGWDQTLDQRLLVMLQNHAQQAESKIKAPDLDALEVRSALQQDQASLTFVDADIAVRDTLQSALPRLRELLDGQGIQLYQTTVAGQSLIGEGIQVLSSLAEPGKDRDSLTSVTDLLLTTPLTLNPAQFQLQKPADSSVLSVSPAAPQLPLDLKQSDWDQTLSRHLLGMIQNHAQQVEFEVNPPHLGPLRVHLALQQDQASLTFVCTDTAVQNTLQSALPRLRELLDGQGIQLYQTTVADQSLARQHQDPGGRPFHQGGWTMQGESDAGADAEVEQSVSEWRLGSGTVDHYV